MSSREFAEIKKGTVKLVPGQPITPDILEKIRESVKMVRKCSHMLRSQDVDKAAKIYRMQEIADELEELVEEIFPKNLENRMVKAMRNETCAREDLG